MKKMTASLAVLVLLLGAAYFWWHSQRSAPHPLEPVQPAASSAQADPAIRYPMPQPDAQAASEPLPVLDESDRSLRNALTDLLGAKSFAEFFNPQHIVRNIVVTIDNLPRKVAVARLFPTRQVSGTFAVTGRDEALFIAPDNAARYTPFVRLAETVDTKVLMALYTRFYPLFQRGYQELGYPKQYFNDRVVATIDHLLAAPEVEGPVRLVQPHVLYQYADPELEAASAGHKIMIRMGSENAARIKARLRELRRELTRGS
jgi:hypothetical protein